jgi:hypothetical protein
MREKKWTYTLAAANAAGFMATAVLTGAGPTFNTIAGAPGDGLAHLLSVTSGANIATIVFTITGTDANDNIITTTVTGVNANTVTTTVYFKTVSSVSISATLGVNTASVGWTAVGYTPIIPLAGHTVAQATIQCDVGATTCNYTPVQSVSPVVADHTAMSWLAATAAGAVSTVTTLAQAATACRVLVNSHTSGVLIVSLSQGRG